MSLFGYQPISLHGKGPSDLSLRRNDKLRERSALLRPGTLRVSEQFSHPIFFLTFKQQESYHKYEK
jgi:hypothetical protein